MHPKHDRVCWLHQPLLSPFQDFAGPLPQELSHLPLTGLAQAPAGQGHICLKHLSSAPRSDIGPADHAHRRANEDLALDSQAG